MAADLSDSSAVVNFEALHLDPGPLTTAFRWLERGEVSLPTATRVG